MTYLRYCIVGKDTEFSFSPVDVGKNGFILCDGLYDICDSPYQQEFCRLAMPEVFKQYKNMAYGEYFNSKTGLLVEFQPGEEGFEPEIPKTAALSITHRRYPTHEISHNEG